MALGVLPVPPLVLAALVVADVMGVKGFSSSILGNIIEEPTDGLDGRPMGLQRVEERQSSGRRRQMRRISTEYFGRVKTSKEKRQFKPITSRLLQDSRLTVS